MGAPVPSMGLASQSVAAAYARGQRSGEPRFLGRDARSCRIVHRELIASITGTATFTVANTFALNPGIALTFPWLSTQASSWEQYRFNKLKFCYYSRCATSTSGSMMLVPDYDAADAAPVSEQIASSYRDVVEEVPWTLEFSCVLDPRSLMEPSDRKFIRTGNLASNLDIKTYDGGNLFVCTTDGSSTGWGKLWVEYDVELFVPQLPPTGTALQRSALITSGGTTSKTAYLGASPVVTGGLAVTGVTNTITFSDTGQFLVVVDCTGTVFTGGAPTQTGTATVTPLYTTLINAAATNAAGVYLVSVPSSGLTLALDWSGVSTTITSSLTRIAPYAYALG